jgi:hypothetical protein
MSHEMPQTHWIKWITFSRSRSKRRRFVGAASRLIGRAKEAALGLNMLFAAPPKKRRPAF